MTCFHGPHLHLSLSNYIPTRDVSSPSLPTSNIMHIKITYNKMFPENNFLTHLILKQGSLQNNNVFLPSAKVSLTHAQQLTRHCEKETGIPNIPTILTSGLLDLPCHAMRFTRSCRDIVRRRHHQLLRSEGATASSQRYLCRYLCRHGMLNEGQQKK